MSFLIFLAKSVYLSLSPDVEGWHKRLNSHAGKSELPFYVLTTLLKEEAEDIDMTLKLVFDRKIKRIHSKSYRTLQGRLHNCWDTYANGDLSSMQLLAKCSYFVPFQSYHPVLSTFMLTHDVE